MNVRVLNTLIHWTQFQIQMEKLASRHAISELFNWISLMENVIEEDEENLKSAVGSNVIQDYLQKYKVADFSRRSSRFTTYLTAVFIFSIWGCERSHQSIYEFLNTDCLDLY